MTGDELVAALLNLTPEERALNVMVLWRDEWEEATDMEVAPIPWTTEGTPAIRITA
ncbi:hypothetical protein SEA_SHROOMS_50 [Arthrobacter phage Shrooms]|nr:hypothetical protein SEA_SHROOMS_50 [Arthrobacter phage Shrooms]